MKTIENQFTPYGLALKLKSIGFDEECTAGWRNNRFSIVKVWYMNQKQAENNLVILAPTYQQAFEFFEDKYKLYSIIDNVVLSYGIADCRDGVKFVRCMHHNDSFKTREEVKYACLNELINSIKQSNENNIQNRNS